MAVRVKPADLSVLTAHTRFAVNLLDVACLVDIHQIACIVQHTHTSRYGTVIAEGIAQDKSYHAELEICGFFRLGNQIIMQLHKTFFAVIIIGIDNRKGLMDNVLTCQNRLAGSPGLRPVCGLCKAARKIIQLLISICHISNLLDPITDDFLEILLKILADDENDPVKTSLQCVLDGVIHDDLSIGSHRLQLLDAAAKTAADTSRHNCKCCFHCTHLRLPFCCCLQRSPAARVICDIIIPDLGQLYNAAIKNRVKISGKSKIF